MIKKLRKKFIAAAMLSLFTVLLIIMTAAGILNYHTVVSEADGTLSMLAKGEGRFLTGGQQFQRPDEQLQRQGELPHMSPELPYESRFFSVVLDQSGAILSADIDHIAAIDADKAADMANAVFYSGKSRGFRGSYRYTVTRSQNTTRVIFLDCTRALSNFRSFLWTSLAICFIGLAAGFILMLLVSDRIMRPVSQSYEKQKQFITDAGHEIKTPITIIDADAEVLEMEIGENEWLTDIRKQTERLAALTGDLIYLSRMEEEQLKLQTIDFPLSDMVADTAASFAAPAKAQQKLLETHIVPNLPYHGDEKALRQLVGILLDNALKYSPEKSVITLSLQKQGKNIVLQTANISAQTLSPTELPHLFERFYRSDKSRSLQKGHGIGLSVAAAVAAAHKGKISASLSGQTLIITLTLPI